MKGKVQKGIEIITPGEYSLIYVLLPRNSERLRQSNQKQFFFKKKKQKQKMT